MNNLELRAKAELKLRELKKQRMSSYSDSLEYYRTAPWDYFAEKLGISRETYDWNKLPEYSVHKWDGTENPLMEILTALSFNKWVGVESATGTGKTFIGAMIVFWFLECFKNSIVVTTAPKQDQLSLHIWKEIGAMFAKFNRGELTSLRLRMKKESDEWLAVGFVAGIKANEESNTRAQGFHAEHMLIILEETPGIPQPIITALQNTCTAPHNLILAFGNPDHQLDNLHRFCMKDNVEHIRISAYDHPNVVLNNSNFIPGACSRVSLQRLLSAYGEDNPMYLSRARGLSPNQSKDSLIRLEWCVSAADRYSENNDSRKDSLKCLGVDVANSETGDKAALAYGEGNSLLSITDFQCPDANELGKRDVVRIVAERGITDHSCIGVDGVGVGAGTINALKEIGYYVTNLIGSESPADQNRVERFNNLRSQMYWQIREDLRNNIIALPRDEELFADLTTPKWSTRNGMIIVESKEEIKKRLGHSPNKGDSAVYWNWIRYIKTNQNTELDIWTGNIRELEGALKRF